MIAAFLLACAPEPAPEPPLAEAGEARRVSTAEEVELRADGVGSSFYWDFGDGAVAEGEVVRHRWEEPGHYTLRLTATAEDGATHADTARITALNPPRGDLAPPASTMALVGETAWVLLPDHDRLARVELSTLSVEREPTCASPAKVAARADAVWVACPEVDTLRAHGASPRELRLRWGARPTGLALTPSGGLRVAAAGTGEVLAVLDEGTPVAVADLPDVRGLSARGDDLLAVAWRPQAGATRALLIPPGEGPLRPFELPSEPGPDSDTHTRGLFTWAEAPTISPDGEVAIFAGLNANVERGLFLEGTRFEHDTTVRAAARRVDLGTGALLASVPFDDRDLVSAVAFSPDGALVAFGFVGAGVIELRDALDLSPLARWSVPDAHPITGLAFGGDGLLWAHDPFGDRLLAFDAEAPGPAPVRQVALAEGLPDPLPPEVRLGRAIFHRSADRRMSPNGYVSCAVCHLEGQQDGHVWDFTQRGEGLRNSLPLRGLGAGPLHWSANFDELQDFENDIRLHQGGDGFLDEADWDEASDPLGPPKAGRSEALDALAAWMGALPPPSRSPHRAPDGGATEAMDRGESAFIAHACDQCHAGPRGTDATWLAPGAPLLHDVGTLHPGSGQRLGGPLSGLRTPSLRGAHATAPYLHDGSAPTVEAAIGAHVPDLPADELADLAAFVRGWE